MNSQQIITSRKEIVKTADKKVLLKFSVKKTTDGISIYVQSDIFEAFFKKNGRSDRSGSWNGVQPYYINKGIRGNYRDRLCNWGGMLFWDHDNDLTNLSYITASGITEGVTILDNNVYSEEEILKFNRSFYNSVLDFYKQYVKHNEHEMTIYLEERTNNEII